MLYVTERIDFRVLLSEEKYNIFNTDDTAVAEVSF